MAARDADLLCPGHGPPITGAANVKRALTDAAEYLRSIIDQTIAAMNAGLRHEEIVASVTPPAALADRPYLQPIYDRPEFIVRNLIRLHGGWWDGFPSSLLPAPADARAREIAALAGGVDAVVARARELAGSDLPLACHLAEWAALADPSSSAAQECARDLFRGRVDTESSLMGRGIFMHAVREAEAALSQPG
jgi:alkyl sulfatase BDS1-like metallo-beta-lactamase superfamily hydrolase